MDGFPGFVCRCEVIYTDCLCGWLCCVSCTLNIEVRYIGEKIFMTYSIKDAIFTLVWISFTCTVQDPCNLTPYFVSVFTPKDSDKVF